MEVTSSSLEKEDEEMAVKQRTRFQKMFSKIPGGSRCGYSRVFSSGDGELLLFISQKISISVYFNLWIRVICRMTDKFDFKKYFSLL
jgi:hypothetical protein